MPRGPEIPEGVDPRDLDPAVRGALRGLDPRNAQTVAAHLVAAGTLLDDDPAEALAHARAARDRASRIAAVREAVGVAAYHAGDYAEAAREIRAYRRMSGDQGYRAVLADCERALGRPDVALRLVAEALAGDVDADERAELRLVEAGARMDLGETAAARLVLEAELGGRPDPSQLRDQDQGRLRVASAYAGLLRSQGEEDRADEWLGAIAAADPDAALGAVDDLGVEFLEVELEDEDAGFEDAGLEDVGLEDVGFEDVEAEAGDEPPAPPAENRAARVPRMTFDEEVEAEVAELLGETDDDADGATPQA
ncbi:hypothetical protein [Blastococcus sp. PRF04-17]|uniref:hypothetical protein n=1 Tax=Blastococcus sp. PRF04-17 TaxID=2933797 RepID=UPI001FF20284|nr:hypothetical protein [Blastococcus sp. PRF04-17]UOY02661.1 hypothetical protein MVA48_04655 [Blastococcus sp. PRF04-17]